MSLQRECESLPTTAVSYGYRLRQRTSPDTRLPQLRAGGQGPYLRSQAFGQVRLIRALKNLNKANKVRPDCQTNALPNQLTNQWTQPVIEVLWRT